ncbi:MAG TPA: hypothetical protein VFB72_09100 [Verrucomicrobiae bacterium]|nr:hypothetical protein [Verrucomicrobiae bacterium]
MRQIAKGAIRNIGTKGIVPSGNADCRGLSMGIFEHLRNSFQGTSGVSNFPSSTAHAVILAQTPVIGEAAAQIIRLQGWSIENYVRADAAIAVLNR